MPISEISPTMNHRARGGTPTGSLANPPGWGIADKYDWSPDGKLIVVTTHAHFVPPGESANVVAIRPNGTIATRITRFAGGEKNAFAGSFSPDGKQIILRLERGDTYTLATVDRDGSNLAR